MGYSNSSLVTYKNISPNCYSPRNHSIDRITIHHMAWVQCTAKKCADSFAVASRQASANYCVGYDGDIALSVEEKNAAWTSSNSANDNRAVTIEVANSKGSPNWEVSSKSYEALIGLVTDICIRNGKNKILWFGDKNKTLAYEPKSNEMVMTVHQWFSATACPGPYLLSKMSDIAEKVNVRLQKSTDTQNNTDDDIKEATADTDSSTDKQIWDFLKSKNLSDIAVAGIMGNLKAESNLRPNNLQNSYEKKLGYTDESYTQAVDNGIYSGFVTDSAGYGLAQWTYHTRKANLLAYAKDKGKSIGDLQMQLEFLWKEMQGYTTMIGELSNAKKIKDASDSFLFRFERPADQGSSVQLARASYATEFYNKFAADKSAPVLSAKLYKVQVGAFKVKTNADQRVAKLARLGIGSIIKTTNSYYKVQAGAFANKDNAQKLLEKIKPFFDDAYIIYG